MDQKALVGASILAGADLIRKLGLLWPVRAAFWLRGADDDWVHLFIAIEGWRGAERGPVYRDLSRIGKETSNLDFDESRVNIIDASDPRARAAIELNERYPNPKGHRNGPRMFGDVFVEDTYIYPMPLPATMG